MNNEQILNNTEENKIRSREETGHKKKTIKNTSMIAK